MTDWLWLVYRCPCGETWESAGFWNGKYVTAEPRMDRCPKCGQQGELTDHYAFERSDRWWNAA